MVARLEYDSPTANDRLTLAVNRRPWLIAILYVALSALALYPLWTVNVPPLIDYPNHLARIHILSTWDSSPHLQQNYDVRWPLQPNLAMDVFLTPLARVLPIYEAGRLFIAATLLLLIGGTITLRKVIHGRVGLWPCLLFPLLYNQVFHWGFLNYLFGVGLCLFALSAWIGLRRRNPLIRLAAFSAVSLLLFFVHLVAFGLYGLALCGYEFWRARADGLRWSQAQLKDGLVAAGQFAAPLILLALWYVDSGGASQSNTDYGTLAIKLRVLTSPINFSQPLVDLCGALLVAALAIWARRHNALTIDPALKWPIVLIAVAAMLMPHKLAGVWGTDFRIPLVAALLLVAAIRDETSAARPGQLFALAGALLLLFRVVAIDGTWQVVGRQHEEFRQATQAIDAGSSLLVVLDVADKQTDPHGIDPRAYLHMASLAVIERDLFLPNMFSGHTTVAAASARAAIDSPVARPITRERLRDDADAQTARFRQGHALSHFHKVYWIGWPDTFDYVLVIRFQNRSNPLPARLQAVHSGSFFDIYRIVKQAPAGRPGDSG